MNEFIQTLRRRGYSRAKIFAIINSGHPALSRYTIEERHEAVRNLAGV